MSENFWNIPAVDTNATPFSILKEQADSLTRSTEYALYGNVDRKAIGGNIENKLSIRVPSLDDYVVDLISYAHGVAMYPGYYRYELGDKQVKISGETQLRNALRETLGSAEVSKIVGSLLAQARSG